MTVRLVDTDLPDEQLAQRAQQGCGASFELLVRRFQTPLLHFLRSRGVGFDDAEDLLQETFIRADRHLARYQPKRRFSTWLFTIAYRLMVNLFRDARPHAGAEALQGMPSSSPQPLDELTSRETQTRLWQIARRTLTAPQFTVLWLHCVQDMALKDIGQVTGQSSVSVRASMFRARKKLLPHLEAAAITPQYATATDEATRVGSCTA